MTVLKERKFRSGAFIFRKNTTNTTYAKSSAFDSEVCGNRSHPPGQAALGAGIFGCGVPVRAAAMRSRA